MAFTAQARGFFTKAASGGVDSLKPERRKAFENAATLARLARVQSLAQQLNTSVTAIVLAYIYSQPFVSVPIIGPNTLEQLQDSLAHADLTLTPAMVEYLTTGKEEK
jgi:aryl-alcohol dehydrogenase-like predicted oxidoreductase